MKFIYLSTLIIPGLCFSNVPKSSFSFYLNEYITTNTSYRQVLVNEQVAVNNYKTTWKQQFFPTLSMSLSRSKTVYDLLPENSDHSQTLSTSLSGNISRLGLSYSSTLYNDSRTEAQFYGSTTNKYHSGSYSFSFDLQLLKGNAISVGSIPFDQLEISEKLSHLSAKKALLDGTQNLLQKYIQVRNLEYNFQTTLKEKERNEELLAKDELRYKLGQIPKLNILNQITQKENFRTQLISQKRSMLQAKNELYTFIGKDFGNEEFDRLILDEIEREIFDENQIKTWLREGIDFRTTRNIEYTELKYNLKNTQLSLDQSKNNLWPSLSVSAGRSYSQKSQKRMVKLFNDTQHTDSVSLTLSMPIGFISEKNDYRNKRANYNIQVLTYKQRKESLVREWEQLKNDYLFALEELESVKSLVDFAQQRYDSSLPTANLGSTFQDNILKFQNELLQYKQSYNEKLNQIFLLKVKMYSFHGDISFIEKLRTN